MGGRARRQVISVAVLLLALTAIVGSEEDDDGHADFRWPCDFATEVAPTTALFVHWSNEDEIDFDRPGLAESIWLEDAGGEELPLLRSVRGEGLVALCPEGGLEPDSAYRWNLTSMGFSDHHEHAPRNDVTGWYQFGTGPATDPLGPTTLDRCQHLELPVMVQRAVDEGCDPCREPDDWPGCPAIEDSGEAGR
jgi:hypothetical protein